MHKKSIPTRSDSSSWSDVVLDSFISTIDNSHSPKCFNTIHEIIIRGSYYGKFYATIAKENGYDCGYIKTTGYQLWNLLSKYFGTEVRKKNIAIVVRRYGQKAQLQNKTDILSSPDSFCLEDLSSRVIESINRNSENPISNTHIAGSSVRVKDILICYKQKRMSPDAIASYYPELNLSDVYAALAYYYRNLENSCQSKADKSPQLQTS